MTCYHRDEVTREGHPFCIEFHTDDCMGAPWDEHDGHGIVSDWTSRDKLPGEWILSNDCGMKRFYDVAATTKKAKAEGWGISGDTSGMTRGQIVAEAVRRDFEHLRGWCENRWHWAGVVVFPMTEDGDELRSKTASLWGIESNADFYMAEVAEDLIVSVLGLMGWEAEQGAAA